ncbi:MAG: hypothetical protein FJ335_02950 [Sphingomonadales bacterium]|nr:hypothetical protein [Sphingomonadales bacterium]
MPADENRKQTIALIRTLIEDVIAANDRLQTSDTQTARRDVVRASIAAIEAEVWLVRGHVRDALQSLDALSPLADLALRETTYSVGENGRLQAKERSVPIPTAIKFVSAQAAIICPNLEVDFTHRGWESLQRAIKIRDRITHPRPMRGLDVSSDELFTVKSGLFWVIGTVDYIMASTNLIISEAREILKQLIAGDEGALAEYQAALASLN